MNIAIIKYNAGNVQSVQYALQRIGYNSIVTDEIEKIKSADKVIFPGVGNAAAAMLSLQQKGLNKLIPELKQPVLGICVGMQLLCTSSEENDTKGLGIIELQVKKFVTADYNIKIPHMGWNRIYDMSSSLFNSVDRDAYVYYVHSYYAELGKETIATTNYIQPFSAVIQKNNFYGVQFHTEKSGEIGDRILSNFLKL